MTNQITKKYSYDYYTINGFSKKKLVQIGACDGVMADNVRELIVSFNIESLLVEPVSYNYNRLVENYKNIDCVKLIQCAIDDQEGTRDITYFESVPGADHMIGVASFYDTQWKKVFPNSWKTETVKCKPLSLVLSQNKMSDANIYQIDTEGHDYHIVKQLDFSSYINKDFFLVSEHFWDDLTLEFDTQKKEIIDQITSMGFDVKTIYGRRSGNKNGLQVSMVCK